MYTPGRDYRFEYLWDLMEFIEEHQCRTCAFSKLVTDNNAHAEEYPMCWAVEAQIMAEDGPVAALDDRGVEGVVCTRYRNAEAAVEEENQDTLF